MDHHPSLRRRARAAAGADQGQPPQDAGGLHPSPRPYAGGRPSFEEKLKRAGVVLPPAPTPLGAYVPAVRVERLLFLSGQLPLLDGKLLYTGKVGAKLTVEEGYQAARVAALNALAVVRRELGTLDLVERIVRVVGHVASAPGFSEQPKVLNGASEVLVEIFGEQGKHTRVALGAAELPLNSPVEIELLVQIRRGGGRSKPKVQDGR